VSSHTGSQRPSPHRPSRRWLARLVIVPPFLWLALFLLLPFLLVLKISVSDVQFGIPPYTPLFERDGQTLSFTLHLRGFAQLFSDSLYLVTWLNSLKMAAVTTFFCILIGYPLAWQIARSAPRWATLLLLAVILPFWTSLLLRVYAWVGILRNDGLLGSVLQGLGLMDAPLEIYRTDWAVYIGLVYVYLPFFILPLTAVLIKLDERLLEAAYDLGARPWQAFWQITLPLSLPGVLAGALLVGASVAQSLAWALDKPAVAIHHLEGHLLSPLLADDKPDFPFLALLVSGGHTQLMQVDGVGRYTLLGETLDDAAGEAFDKTAKLLGLSYPGGAALSKLAQQGNADAYPLPRPMLHSADLDFSFSGLKTAVLTQVKKLEKQHGSDALTSAQKADLAAATQAAIVDVLAGKAIKAIRQTSLAVTKYLTFHYYQIIITYCAEYSFLYILTFDYRKKLVLNQDRDIFIHKQEYYNFLKTF